MMKFLTAVSGDTAEQVLTNSEKIVNWFNKPQVKATLIIGACVIVGCVVLGIVYRLLKKTGILK